MPCSGPNIDFAEKEANKAYDDVVLLLKERYHVEINPESVIPFMNRGNGERADALKKAIREIVVHQHCVDW